LPRKSRNLEAKVLKELTGPGFKSAARISYSGLASKIGANKESVRAAVKRAEESQSIQKWRILLNPRTIGLELGAVQLDARLGDDSAKATALSQIELIEGVVIVFNYHGSGVRVVFYYESEESGRRKVRLIASLCGSREEDTTLMKVVFPSSGRLRKTDWMVLKAISKNPRRSSAEVASELALSSRTVNRLIKKLTESRAIFLSTIKDVRNSFGLAVDFLIRCSEESKGEVDKLVLGQTLNFVLPNQKEYYSVSLAFNNISEAEEFKGKLEKVQGVHEVRMDILKEHIFVDSWLDDVIQKNAA
jgi:DNA-binding Lrp family transcriptional regulator